MISTSRSAGLMVLQHICKYFVERAHYIVKARCQGRGKGFVVVVGNICVCV